MEYCSVEGFVISCFDLVCLQGYQLNLYSTCTVFMQHNTLLHTIRWISNKIFPDHCHCTMYFVIPKR